MNMKVKVHWVIDGIAELEADSLEDAEKIVNEKLADFVSNNSDLEEKHVDLVDDDDIIFDVGQTSIEDFSKYINSAKTIIWNGPMGYFEEERFAKGTAGIAIKISESQGYSIIGGGETLASFSNLNMMDCVDYASTAGGAFLEYIELGTLPCIEVIKNKKLGN